MKSSLTFAVLLILAAPFARAQSCEDSTSPDSDIALSVPAPEPPAKYASLSAKHRLEGLASYYSTSLEGTLTANGERYRHKRLTAAHLTLPLGCWVELTSRATGRSIRVRVNDRGPYTKKFAIDLSQSAARMLGVDRTEDRWVDIRIVALPGEEPRSSGMVASCEGGAAGFSPPDDGGLKPAATLTVGSSN